VGPDLTQSDARNQQNRNTLGNRLPTTIFRSSTGNLCGGSLYAWLRWDCGTQNPRVAAARLGLFGKAVAKRRATRGRGPGRDQIKKTKKRKRDPPRLGRPRRWKSSTSTVTTGAVNSRLGKGLHYITPIERNHEPPGSIPKDCAKRAGWKKISIVSGWPCRPIGSFPDHSPTSMYGTVGKGLGGSVKRYRGADTPGKPR